MKIVIISVVAVGGLIFGSAKMGIIDVPGISPQPAAKKTQKQPPQKPDDTREHAVKGSSLVEEGASSAAQPSAHRPDERSAANASSPKPAPSVALNEPTESKIERPRAPQAKPSHTDEVAPTDDFAGEKKLARLWAKLDAQAIVRMVEKWKDLDLARQLYAMSPAQAGEVMAALKPEHASRVAKLVGKIAVAEAERQRKSEAASKATP